MINETSVQISKQYKRWQGELRVRHARRNKVRHIDRLLNQLELLNLSDAESMGVALRHQVMALLDEYEHPVSRRAAKDLRVCDCIEALFDVQDTLLLGGEDEEETS